MASRLCSKIGTSHGRAIWREDPEGSPRRCGLIVGLTGLIFAKKALYGSGAAMTTPAKSGRASGSVSSGMRTGSCDFIFGAVPSSAVQDRSGYKRRYYGRPPPLLKGVRVRSPVYSAGDPVSLHELLGRIRIRRTLRCHPKRLRKSLSIAQVEDPGAWPGRRERVEVQRQLHLVDRESDRRRQ